MMRPAFAAAIIASLMAAPMLPPRAAAQTASTDVAAKPKKPLTANQLAARDRQAKCAAEWKEAKAAGKIEEGMTWPKYWHGCNARLKAAALAADRQKQ